MSARARIGLVSAAVVLLVVAFVIARGGDDGKKASDAATTAAPAQTTPDAGATATDEDTADTTAAPAAPAVPVITVVDAKPKGGVQRLTFTKGDTIRFKVASDTADEIHFHGYDVGKDVAAGGTASFAVKATIEGRFEVELEEHGTQIAEVEVDPS